MLHSLTLMENSKVGPDFPWPSPIGPAWLSKGKNKMGTPSGIQVTVSPATCAFCHMRRDSEGPLHLTLASPLPARESIPSASLLPPTWIGRSTRRLQTAGLSQRRKLCFHRGFEEMEAALSHHHPLLQSLWSLCFLLTTDKAIWS